MIMVRVELHSILNTGFVYKTSAENIPKARTTVNSTPQNGIKSFTN